MSWWDSFCAKQMIDNPTGLCSLGGAAFGISSVLSAFTFTLCTVLERDRLLELLYLN